MIKLLLSQFWKIIDQLATFSSGDSSSNQQISAEGTQNFISFYLRLGEQVLIDKNTVLENELIKTLISIDKMLIEKKPLQEFKITINRIQKAIQQKDQAFF